MASKAPTLLFWTAVVVLLVLINYTAVTPAIPKYNLLFATDYDDVPYTSPNSHGIVIQVENHRAVVIFTGSWQLGTAPYAPRLYICHAATGSIHEIAIPVKGTEGDLTLYAKRTVLTIPELRSFTIDNSSIAPNGYALRGFKGYSSSIMSFDKTYAYLNLIDEWPTSNPVQLRQDNYQTCIRKVGNHSVGLTVHFIGWVIPP